MFIKLTRSGGHTYAQLVESFRDEHGKPRQRTVATIGRVDEADGQVDSLLSGLLRAKGRSLGDSAAPQVRFESALALGDVWMLEQLWHELGFDGLAGVFRRAHIRRLVVVADRGLLSLDNIEALSKLRLSGEPTGAAAQALEFILAVPCRRYGEFADILEPINTRASASEQETIDETQWQGLRLVVAHNPQQAAEQTANRQARIEQLRQRADQLVGKLDSQDAGKVHRGRKLSDTGVTARFFHEVSEAHLRRIIKVDLQAELFTWDIDQDALAAAQAMDGKLLLVTNVQDLTPQDVVRRYKALADIERGFRVLKSEIEIAPVFHRLPERIKAHASICMLALILYRVMRQRLKMGGSNLSPEAALADLRRIQRHSVSINNAAPIAGISTIAQRQTDVLAALKIKKPSHDIQLSLL
jgi:transposase